jgi:hypothetical protein
MNDINTGGSAFPSAHLNTATRIYKYVEGMTLRQYAAIKLKAPDSGTDWLDDMIRKSLKDDFAARAMQSFAAHDMAMAWSNDRLATETYNLADAMLKAREA